MNKLIAKPNIQCVRCDTLFYSQDVFSRHVECPKCNKLTTNENFGRKSIEDAIQSALSFAKEEAERKNKIAFIDRQNDFMVNSEHFDWARHSLNGSPRLSPMLENEMLQEISSHKIKELPLNIFITEDDNGNTTSMWHKDPIS